jgi:hypothetical protein
MVAGFPVGVINPNQREGRDPMSQRKGFATKHSGDWLVGAKDSLTAAEMKRKSDKDIEMLISINHQLKVG